MDLSSWSAIAAIIAVPLMVVGWFVGARKQETNNARASGAGTATVGDMNAESGSLLIGHNAQISLNTLFDNAKPRLQPNTLNKDIAATATAVLSIAFTKSGMLHGEYDLSAIFTLTKH